MNASSTPRAARSAPRAPRSRPRRPSRLVGVGLDPHGLDQRLAGAVVRVRGRPVVDRQHPLRPPRDCVEAGVGRDPVEPGAERTSICEPGQPAPGTQQRLLQRVLGVVHRAEHAVAVGVQLSAIRLDQAGRRRSRRRREPLEQPLLAAPSGLWTPSSPARRLDRRRSSALIAAMNSFAAAGLNPQSSMRGHHNPLVHLELHTGDLPCAPSASTRSSSAGAAEQHLRRAAGPYQTFELGRRIDGGIVECETGRPLWLPYVEVPDVGEVTERARAARSEGDAGAARGTCRLATA